MEPLQPSRPLNFKDADIITHAIHSRLQLVRDKVAFNKEWDSPTSYLNFINLNHDLLNTIKKNVTATHKVNVSVDPHVQDAAKMFMFTMGWTGESKDS
jgi:hypothetical protein